MASGPDWGKETHMDITATTNNTLTIERLQTQYLVAAQHPAPEHLKARLDDALLKNLPTSLATLSEQWLAPSDNRVLLIQRLTIDLDINAAWDHDVLARHWAAQIIRVLDDIRQGKSTSENVVWYADRAAYLAHFLGDLASGHAWGKWYYTAFAGLRMLPTSAALRSAICAQPSLGLTALLQLKTLTPILEALNTQDVRRIVESLANEAGPAIAIGPPETPDTSIQQHFTSLWSLWEDFELSPSQVAQEWHTLLRLYLGMMQHNPKLAGNTLLSATRALLRLTVRCSSVSATTYQAILTALQRGDTAALYAAAGPTDAAILLPLAHCSPHWIQAVGTALLQHQHREARNNLASADNRYVTPFGSLFLLLPIFDELPLEQATREWPVLNDMPAVALIRFLLFLKCLGQPGVQRAFHDPLVRRCFAIDPTLTLFQLAQWQRTLTSQHLASFLSSLLSKLYEIQASNGHTSLLVRVTLPGSPVALLLDGERGHWIAAASYRRSTLPRLAQQFSQWLPLCGHEETILLCDERFIEAMHSALPDLPIVSLQSPVAQEHAVEDQAVQETLKRLDKLSSELAHLTLPVTFGRSRSCDLTLSIAAQAIMRLFAWRLPGFARSSLPHLYANFLDISASLEEEDARYVVRLRPPPLNFILHLSGMNRRSYTLSWLDERPFMLFPEE
jgi:hypothetical protein